MKVNLTRGDVIKAVSVSFGIDKETVERLLNRDYPTAFFPVISMQEYQLFLENHKNKFIIALDKLSDNGV